MIIAKKAQIHKQTISCKNEPKLFTINLNDSFMLEKTSFFNEAIDHSFPLNSNTFTHGFQFYDTQNSMQKDQSPSSRVAARH